MDGTKPKPYVFILMPFGEDFDEIYTLGIKAACENAGAYCERVDEQVFVESILERIYNQIAKADVIVSDMTGRNSNVFYETGYAHALNKQVVLLTQNADDIPFDLKHYPHILYGGKIIPLKEQLETRIRWCVENPRNSLSSVDINLEFSINKIFLVDNPVILIHASDKKFFKYFPLAVNIHNLGNKVVEPKSFSISIVLPEWIDVESSTSVSSHSQISDEKQIANLQATDRLFPDSWYSLQVSCRILTNKLSSIPSGRTLELLLRLHTEIGPKDFPFRIKLDFSQTA